jgi:hypothetical protein
MVGNINKNHRCPVKKTGGKPKKAISYFSSSLAKHGKKGRRPNVEIPEKTESAYVTSS